MTDRELRVAIRQRFSALRIAVHQRRTELISATEAELLDRYRAECERVHELNQGLKQITDEANRKAVALLREFEDLAEGGRWKGIRQAMFEVPRVHRVIAHRVIVDRAQRHRARITEIEKRTEQALRVLERQQACLLRAPDRAWALMAKGAPAIVTGLIPPTRLWEVEPIAVV